MKQCLADELSLRSTAPSHPIIMSKAMPPRDPNEDEEDEEEEDQEDHADESPVVREPDED